MGGLSGRPLWALGRGLVVGGGGQEASLNKRRWGGGLDGVAGAPALANRKGGPLHPAYSLFIVLLLSTDNMVDNFFFF